MRTGLILLTLENGIASAIGHVWPIQSLAYHSIFHDAVFNLDGSANYLKRNEPIELPWKGGKEEIIGNRSSYVKKLRFEGGGK